jgi:hypothetical protein
MPLPKGRVTLQQYDQDGELLFLGRDAVDHTPVKEELALISGYAFDVVGEQRQLNVVKVPPGNPREQTVTLQVVIRNHKDEPIAVRYLDRQWGYAYWEVTGATHAWEKLDHQSIVFDLTMQPNTEATIQYTVHHRF